MAPARRRVLRALGLLCGVAGILLLVACYREQELDVDRAETLVLVHPNPWNTLDPRFVTDAMGAKISGLVYEPLYRVERMDGEPEGVLAAGIERLPGEAPRYRVRLRAGVRFHDGGALDCQDVVFTYQSILDPEVGSPFQGGYARKWREVTCGPTPDTVDFSLVQDYANLITDLALGIVPAPSPKGYDDSQDPGDASPEWIGTGPFRFVTTQGEHRALLARFDDYWGSPAGVPFLLVQVIAEESSRVLNMVGGAGDICVNGVTPSVAHALRGESSARIVHEPAAIISYMLFNLRNPVLSDRRVRHAIARAVDRESILRDLFFGMGQSADSMLPSVHWAHGAPRSPIRFDLEAARRLLDEAGFPVDPLTGERFRLVFKISNNRLRRLIGRRLTEDLAQVGVGVDLVSYELGTFLSDIRKGNFDLSLLQLPDALEPDLYHWMTYSLNVPRGVNSTDGSVYARAPREGAPTWFYLNLFSATPACRAWARDQGLASLRSMVAPLLSWFGLSTGTSAAGYFQGNRTFYANPHVDCLLDLGRQSLDRERRALYYKEVQRVLAHDLPVFPLWHEDNIALHSERLEGVPLTPVGRYTRFGEVRLREAASQAGGHTK
jgi:peptide/nickel transport system substrate-binding protein